MFDFFVKTVVDEWGTSYVPTTAGYVALVLLIAACLLIAVSLSSRKGKKLKTRELVFCAAAMALATVTSEMKLAHLPFGGSVTAFSMMFITAIGYWYGLRTGLMTAVAYGVLQLVIDPYVIHPAQLIVDYILAFGALGLSGVFYNKKNGLIKGYLLGVFGRYVFAVLSGIIFFAAYAGDQNVYFYSLTYNLTYILPEAIITVILMALPPVAKAFATVKKMANEG